MESGGPGAQGLLLPGKENFDLKEASLRRPKRFTETTSRLPPKPAVFFADLSLKFFCILAAHVEVQRVLKCSIHGDCMARNGISYLTCPATLVVNGLYSNFSSYLLQGQQ